VPTTLPPLSDLRAAARAAWPEERLVRFRVHRVGWANLVLEADERLIFRFPRRRAVARGLAYEVRALGLLARHLTSPIPEPLRLGVLEDPAGWPFLSYRKLPGEPLSRVGPLDSVGVRRLERFLGQLLDDLAAVPARSMELIGADPGDPGAWAERYRSLERRFMRRGASLVPSDLRHDIAVGFERFYARLRTSLFRAVVTHRDLSADHILWDARANRPTGVIDWEDVTLGDPAFDLTGLGGIRSTSPSRWIAARRRRGDRTFDERLDFYRRVWPIHGVIHAAEIGDLRWLRRFLPKLRDGFSGQANRRRDRGTPCGATMK
jgi:aminoglycoside phosphotransferase (APT) family kinase protein